MTTETAFPVDGFVEAQQVRAVRESASYSARFSTDGGRRGRYRSRISDRVASELGFDRAAATLR
jgi:hypothetical protein